jgi:hypothetical protein
MLYEMLYIELKIFLSMSLLPKYKQLSECLQATWSKWPIYMRPSVKRLWIGERIARRFDVRRLSMWDVFIIMNYETKYELHYNYSSCSLSLLKGNQF